MPGIAVARSAMGVNSQYTAIHKPLFIGLLPVKVS
jgi:hypothetical protein